MILKRLYNRNKNGRIAGVYIIRFPNTKIYIGSSNNINRRIVEHLENLVNRNKLWYNLAAKENNIIKREDLCKLSYKEQRRILNNINIKIYYYPCNNYKEEESKLLSSIVEKDRQYCYNKKF